MSGPIRVDWPAIKNRWGVDVDTPHLFALPKGFGSLVLAIAERLQWPATYRINDYDFSDWDELDALVAQGIQGLIDSMPLQTLIDLLDQVEPLLTEIRDKPCCDSETLPPEVIQDPDSIVQPTESTDGDNVTVGTGVPPGGHPDWPAYSSHLCDAAVKFANNLYRLVDFFEVASNLAELGLLTALSMATATAAGLGIIGSAVAGLFSSAGALTFLDDVKDLIGSTETWDDKRAELENEDFKIAATCAIVTASTADEAYTNFLVVLQELAPNSYNLVTLWPIRRILGKIFAALSDASAGFGGGCVECTESVYDFDVTWTFDADTDGWALEGSGAGAWQSTLGGSIRLNDHSMVLKGGQFSTKTGIPLGTTIQLLEVEIDHAEQNSPQGTNRYVRFIYDTDPGSQTKQLDRQTAGFTTVAQGTKTHIVFFTPENRTLTSSIVNVLSLYCFSSSGNASYHYISRVRIKGNTV